MWKQRSLVWSPYSWDPFFAWHLSNADIRHIHVYIYTYIGTHIHTHGYTYDIFMYTCVYIYICVCVCMCVCVCVCIDTHTYVDLCPQGPGMLVSPCFICMTQPHQVDPYLLTPADGNAAGRLNCGTHGRLV